MKDSVTIYCFTLDGETGGVIYKRAIPASANNILSIVCNNSQITDSSGNILSGNFEFDTHFHIDPNYFNSTQGLLEIVCNVELCMYSLERHSEERALWIRGCDE